jgi:hypothetical protein
VIKQGDCCYTVGLLYYWAVILLGVERPRWTFRRRLSMPTWISDETKILTEEPNFAGLARLNRELGV